METNVSNNEVKDKRSFKEIWEEFLEALKRLLGNPTFSMISPSVRRALEDAKEECSALAVYGNQKTAEKVEHLTGKVEETLSLCSDSVKGIEEKQALLEDSVEKITEGLNEVKGSLGQMDAENKKKIEEFFDKKVRPTDSLVVIEDIKGSYLIVDLNLDSTTDNNALMIGRNCDTGELKPNEFKYPIDNIPHQIIADAISSSKHLSKDEIIADVERIIEEKLWEDFNKEDVNLDKSEDFDDVDR